MDKSTIEQLSKRVERLERQNRWLKSVGLMLMAGLLAVIIVATACKDEVPPQALELPSVIEAREFVLVDKRGNERGRFAVVNDMAALQLYDDREDMKIGLHVYNDGLPQIYVNSVLGPGIVIDGMAPAIGFFGENGERIATIP